MHHNSKENHYDRVQRKQPATFREKEVWGVGELEAGCRNGLSRLQWSCGAQTNNSNFRKINGRSPNSNRSPESLSSLTHTQIRQMQTLDKENVNPRLVAPAPVVKTPLRQSVEPVKLTTPWREMLKVLPLLSRKTAYPPRHLH